MSGLTGFNTRISRIFAVCEKSLDKRKWSWTKNSKCKYINVRIDMRDGMCILEDRDGNQISIEKLEHQFN
jgi:hypothetical protein